ncbi:CotH kinase family protein [Desulfitobacterium hafniense]|uniref:CotH kinase family protein n=1 Tax=Desulfitobacterium hafniense TaxID=49338 RepID=UPI000377609A|nr:CotH kinase family protein [Desulfitobacterium hafniense]
MNKNLVRIIMVMLGVSLLILIGFTALNHNEPRDAAAAVDSVLDKDRVMEIHINLDEKDYKDMLDNPMAEEYKIARVEIDGEVVDNVGFRVKGNSSLSMVANSDSDRYSFKIDFDRYIDGQKYKGLTKLNLNNSISDPSYMREYLSYSLFKEMGVATPGFAYADIYVNGEKVGLYLAVEGIEEPFLERYYGNSYGNLYKPEGTGSDLVYIDDNIKSYSGITAAVDKKTGADAALLNMLKVLNEGQDLEKVINVEETLKYFAVNTVLVSMDSYQGTMKHNYYLYEEDGVFTILPWDYNMSFGGFSMGRGGDSSPTTLTIDDPVSGTSLEERPLIGKLLEVEEYKELYHQYIQEFIQGPFSVEAMTGEIERVANLIRPYLEEDPTKFYTMEQFEEAIGEGADQEQANSSEMPTDNRRPNVTNDVQGQGGGGGFMRPEGGSNESGIPEDNRLPEGNGGINRMPGGNRGGNMMMGESTIGLQKFVRERVLNVTQQLNGEIPSTGSQSNSAFPGEGGMGFPDGFQPPDGRAGGERPMGGGHGQGQFPAEGAQGGPFMNGGNRPIDKASVSTEQLVEIGVLLGVLSLLIVLILKKKTKYTC